MSRFPITACQGPFFIINKDITTKSICSIISKLNKEFGSEYKWEPEPITEGGIVCTNWPGKEEGQFKCIRFNAKYGRWPHISKDIIDVWENSKEEQVIWPKQTEKGWLYLKAYYGAPCWTLHELKIFMRIFETVGIHCSKRSLPSKKELKDTNSCVY